MLKRLALDAARADIAAVEQLLAARTAEEDPVGYIQFNSRREELLAELARIEDAAVTGAEVGLFFGGRPVVGSTGISASFSADAISGFQSIVAGEFASMDGELGSRGPVPQRDRAQLMITDIARGSFGFILKEFSETDLLDSALKPVVSRVVDLIYRVATPDEELFSSATDEIDGRVLGSLKSFFKTLDDAGATVRFVDDNREFTLHRDEIELARYRTETVKIEDTERNVRGTLYVLPASKRFELKPSDGGDVLRGTVSEDWLSKVLAEGGDEALRRVMASEQMVHLRVREITAKGRQTRESYQIIDIPHPTA